MRRRTGLGGLALVVGLCGCYRYAPMAGEPVPTVGTSVRALLTTEGATALAPRIGREVMALDGRVVRVEEGAAVLAVSRTLTRDSTEALWEGGEPIRLPREAVAGYERRVLDRRRTAGAAVLGAGALFAIGRIIASISGSGGMGVGGGTTPPAP